jgi:hypothetical protein
MVVPLWFGRVGQQGFQRMPGPVVGEFSECAGCLEPGEGIGSGGLSDERVERCRAGQVAEDPDDRCPQVGVG